MREHEGGDNRSKTRAHGAPTDEAADGNWTAERADGARKSKGLPRLTGIDINIMTLARDDGFTLSLGSLLGNTRVAGLESLALLDGTERMRNKKPNAGHAAQRRGAADAVKQRAGRAMGESEGDEGPDEV